MEVAVVPKEVNPTGVVVEVDEEVEVGSLLSHGDKDHHHGARVVLHGMDLHHGRILLAGRIWDIVVIHQRVKIKEEEVLREAEEEVVTVEEEVVTVVEEVVIVVEVKVVEEEGVEVVLIEVKVEEDKEVAEEEEIKVNQLLIDLLDNKKRK